MVPLLSPKYLSWKGKKRNIPVYVVQMRQGNKVSPAQNDTLAYIMTPISSIAQALQIITKVGRIQ